MRVIIGSEALAAGMVTRNDLRRRYTRMFPDVYGPPKPTIRERARGAWLWSGRRGVIAAVAASALHWAKYVDDDIPIELLWRNGRPPSGLIVRNEIYAADEVTTYDGIPLTTPARTIFDLGRHLNRDAAVARIDALLWLGRVGVPDVEPIAARYPWARGVEKLRVALELADDGAESPRESRLRLLLTDAGMRPTDTQIPVYEGQPADHQVRHGLEATANRGAVRGKAPSDRSWAACIRPAGAAKARSEKLDRRQGHQGRHRQ